MYRKSITCRRLESKVARCAAMREAKARRRMERGVARGQLVEVLRVVFTGSAVGGRKHVVTVDAGEPGEQCVLKVDGVEVRCKSWPRCRAAIVRRIFKAVVLKR